MKSLNNKELQAAIYLRVSTKEQTTENQLLELMGVVKRSGWNVFKVYEDTGISGSKGRDKRPMYDQMLKDAVRRKFDIVMACGQLIGLAGASRIWFLF